jgi:hypothetical protein
MAVRLGQDGRHVVGGQPASPAFMAHLPRSRRSMSESIAMMGLHGGVGVHVG